jgi:hypothetical protein
MGYLFEFGLPLVAAASGAVLVEELVAGAIMRSLLSLAVVGVGIGLGYAIRRLWPKGSVKVDESGLRLVRGRWRRHFMIPELRRIEPCVSGTLGHLLYVEAKHEFYIVIPEEEARALLLAVRAAQRD